MFAVHVSMHANLLFCNFKIVSEVIQIGPSGPDKALESSCKVCSLDNNEIEDGTVPKRLFNCSCKFVSPVKSEITIGIVPVNLL